MTMILWILAGIGLPVLLLIYLNYMHEKLPAFDTEDQSTGPASSSQGFIAVWASRKGLNADLIWIIACTVLSITAYSIFSYNDYFYTDLSYVSVPIIVSLQIIAAGRLIHMFLPLSLNRYYLHLFNVAVIGTAVMLFIFLVFNRSTQVVETFTCYFEASKPERLRTILNIVSQITSTKVYLLLMTSAVIVYRALPFGYVSSHKLERFKDLALAACIFLTGFCLFRALNLFVFTWEPIAGVSWVIFGGITALALSILANYSNSIEDAFVSETSLWISASRIRMFIIGALICSYVVFFRPFLYGKVSWAIPIIEWGLAGLIIWRMYNGIQGKITEKYTIRLKYTSWKKHMKQVESKIDNDLSYAINIQNEFVQNNRKDPLLVYIVTLLHDNDVSIDEIAELVNPLTVYKQENIPLFSSNQKREGIRKQNSEKRKQILNDIMTAVDEKKLKVTSSAHSEERGYL